MADMFFANEVGACGVIAGDDPAGIAQVRRECEIELIAMIDFVDRHQRALAHLAGHHGVRSRLGKYEAERDGRLGHEEARALCGNNLLARKVGFASLYRQSALRIIRKKGAASH
jgi:hypothetical protein